jgi:hypothetical protein
LVYEYITNYEGPHYAFSHIFRILSPFRSKYITRCSGMCIRGYLLACLWSLESFVTQCPNFMVLDRNRMPFYVSYAIHPFATLQSFVGP